LFRKLDDFRFRFNRVVVHDVLTIQAIRRPRDGSETLDADAGFTVSALTERALCNTLEGCLQMAKAAGVEFELPDGQLALGRILNLIQGIRRVFYGDLVTPPEWALQLREHLL